MKKKNKILALALSASFVVGGASIVEASADVTSETPQVIEDVASDLSENDNTVPKESASSSEVTEDSQVIPDEIESSQASSNENEVLEKTQDSSLELEPLKNPQALQTSPAQPENQASNEPSDEEKVTPREGVAKTPDGKVMTETENSVSADENQVEKYRDSDLANNGIVGKFFKEDNGTTKEGVTVNILNPSSTVEDKKKFGIQIDIDRKSSERTYNGVYVTDSQRGVPIRRGSQGELVKPGEDPDFDGVNYPTSEEEAAKIDHNVNVGNQVTINIYTSEEFLKDLNSVDNKRTNFAWKHNYVRDNPTKKAFDGGNFEAGFSVNPYPNENKDLSIIRVVGDTNIEKVPVKGQYIKTGARIENLGEEDYTRVTSEVYHPDGTLVDPKEARAILVSTDNIEEMKDHVGEVSLGDIIFKMPKGALEDPNSIFNNNKFNAIQNLRAEFFARPRTEAEFKKIVENVNKAQGYTDKYYVGTGAGTNTIKHNGEDITIDKQGIARYDHYNTLGTITVNLDDTLYYDQTFDRKLKNKTDKVTSIEPGETKEISIDDAKTKENLGSKPNGKTQDQMNEAEAEGRARGTIDPDFVARAEKQGWKIDRTNVDPNNPDSKIDISKFKITPPADAAPGDFIAIPITYTYTNGSTDIEWFHFVVQDTYTNKPEYHAKFGYQGDKLVSNPTLPSTQSDLKKAQPENYELVGGPTYTDDKGNTWTDVKVDQNTGVVTATVPQDTNIQGGEELFVPVKVTYTDKNTNDTITETVKAQFIARTPEVDNAVVVNEVETEIPFKSKEVFDDTIAMGTIVVESEGTPGTGKVQFKQNVVNGQKGLIDENGTFIPGVDKFFIDKTTVTEPVDRLVKVGVKPVKETVTIPRTVEVEVDPNMEPTAEPVVVEEGNDGLVTVKTKKNPQTGAIEIEKSTTKQANPKKVKVGTKTSGIIVDNDEIPFEYKITKDPNLKKGEYVIDVEGKPGSNTKTWTIENSKVIGDPKVENVDPINAVIRVGDQDFTGTISHDVTEEIPFEVKVIEDDNLEAGKYIVEQEGQKGSKTSTFTQDIKNGQAYGELKTEENITKEPTKHIIRVGKKPATNSVDIDKNIPVDIIYKFDPDKDVTIAEKGDFTPGTVKTVVNNKYNPETGQIESEEKTVITPAKQEIIVGTKKYTGEFTNEFTEEIPFETEIIIDDSLEAGEKRVENPGKLGSKTTKVTQNFVNGKQVSINKEEINKTDPEKRVIKVGSKTNGEHSHIEKIPFKYDENLQAGQYKIEVEGKPGERKTTWNIVNSKIDGSPIVSETPAVDAIIKVGNKDFTGSFETVDKDPIPFETEYRIDNTLEQGKEVLVQEGILGENSTRTIHIIVNGQVTQSNEGETNQTKAPKKKIVKIGAKTDGEHKVTEEIPFKIEVKKDPTLKKGEWKYEQDENGEDKTGVVGSQEKTLTIENSEVTNISDPTVTKQAQNAVILVGDEDFTGEITNPVTEDLPFEVEIIEDENLTCGTIEEVQEGIKGSKTTIYKQKIKNGQADGEMTFEEDSSKRKNPTNRIIRLGKKAPEGTETTVNKEIPVEIEYVYDDSKDKGYVEKGDLTQAKVETKVVSKVVDGKVVNTEETQVTPAKQKIIVGTKDYTGEFEYKDTDTIPFETEVTIDPSLKPNEIVEDQAGQEGLKERVVNQSFTNGTKAKQVVGEYTITKEPVNRKIRIGAKIDGAYEYKEEIPFEVEIRKNKNLNKGEHRLIQQGLPGEKTTSLIIENSKIKGDPKSKVSKDPVKHIIEIGDEDFTGEFTDEKTYENNYKIQIIFDENLESGKIEEIQEGINSKYKYQVKQKIVNGSITEKISNTTELEKGQDRIVKVGTKELTKEVPVEKIVEVVKEVPVEKIVEVVKEVPVEIIKEVPVEVIKEVPVEVIKEIPVEILKDSPGIIVKHNEDLKAGEIKIVDKGEKKVTRIKDGKKEVLSEGRKMIVEVGSKKIVEKCQNPTNPEEKPSDEKTDEDTNASIDKVSEDNRPSDNKKPSEDEENPGKDNETLDDSKLPQTDDKEDNPSEDRPKERPSQEDKDGEKPSEDRPKDENTPTKDNNTSDDTNNDKTDGELKLEEKNKASQRKKEIPNKRFIKKDNLSSKIKDDTNPKTGISSLSGILNALGLSALAFKKSKKKK